MHLSPAVRRNQRAVKELIAIVAAAWAETAEPDKLAELHPDQLFYTIADFADWIFR